MAETPIQGAVVIYVLTGYSRKQYLIVTALGVAAWIAQSFLGVTVLAAAEGFEGES